MSRLVRLPIVPEVLLSLLSVGARWAVAEFGLPPDTELVRLDQEEDRLVLILKSEEFPEVADGQPIPQWPSTRLESL